MTLFLHLSATAPAVPCSFDLLGHSLLFFAPLPTSLFVLPSLFSSFLLLSRLSVFAFLTVAVLRTLGGLTILTGLLYRRCDRGRRCRSWRMRGRRWWLRREGGRSRKGEISFLSPANQLPSQILHSYHRLILRLPVHLPVALCTHRHKAIPIQHTEDALWL